MTMGAKSFSTLMVAVALFGLAGGVIAATIPYLSPSHEKPVFTVFLAAGFTVIVLTALLFGFIDRMGLGFGRTALILAFGYNALIGTVKLGLAPAGLYRANELRSFDTSAGDPNSPLFYIAVGTAVLLLYLTVFRVMYRLFKRRFRRRSEGRTPEPRTEQADTRSGRRITLIVLVAVGVAVLAAIFWIVPVFFVALPTLSYLTYIFTTFGVAIAAALSLAAFFAYKTFDEVEKRAARLGDAALLANFFWLGLSLILLYHVMWAVFLLTLVSIWPFRTYTPK